MYKSPEWPDEDTTGEIDYWEEVREKKVQEAVIEYLEKASQDSQQGGMFDALTRGSSQTSAPILTTPSVSEVKFCPNCGAKKEGTSNFCTRCGTAL